ncbi:MAG: hypothetical protein HETSPECPRED_000755 [Heterodermia speciosa]|uniref:Radical SAM core domain-containing protein n=1 Tax=Heterodermia speciosa TaxID=116794 RepID=A0A8H3GD46_9LECA|nr:MAG: hypothetical protein HETSPECPRED_000755 [Heterodermia speciosa]
MFLTALTLLLGALLALVTYLHQHKQPQQPPKKIPLSVNYHLTRQCNYSCGFCFHTAKTSSIAPLSDAQKAMTLLQRAGMKKINFAGGEPFLHAQFLGQLAQYCKQTLRLESVSIVTNGSKVTAAWLERYGRYIDIMAVSVDSFDEATNVKIGRGKGRHLETVKRLAGWCRSYGVMFKVNTVVNRYNLHEDMNAPIRAIGPVRWKCFQVLIVPEENGGGAETLRDARRFQISDEEFEGWCERHRGGNEAFFVPEGNGVMRSSYLLLDEELCFLNKGVGGKTGCVLEVGVEEALRGVYWDEEGFGERGGVYEWTKPGGEGEGCECGGEEGAKGELDW